MREGKPAAETTVHLCSLYGKHFISIKETKRMFQLYSQENFNFAHICDLDYMHPSQVTQPSNKRVKLSASSLPSSSISNDANMEIVISNNNVESPISSISPQIHQVLLKCYKKNLTIGQTYRHLFEEHNKQILSWESISKWFQRFRNGQDLTYSCSKKKITKRIAEKQKKKTSSEKSLSFAIQTKGRSRGRPRKEAVMKALEQTQKISIVKSSRSKTDTKNNNNNNNNISPLPTAASLRLSLKSKLKGSSSNSTKRFSLRT